MWGDTNARMQEYIALSQEMFIKTVQMSRRRETEKTGASVRRFKCLCAEVEGRGILTDLDF
jgi:hypothetical protein